MFFKKKSKQCNVYQNKQYRDLFVFRKEMLKSVDCK